MATSVQGHTRRPRRRPSTGVRILLVGLVTHFAAACAYPRTEPAAPGQRIQVSTEDEVPNQSTNAGSARLSGELVRRAADTVWVRAAPLEQPRAFLIPAARTLPARFASHATDPLLVGDSLREGRLFDGRRRWTVVGLDADTILLAGPFLPPTSLEPQASRELFIQRQTRRVRPRGALITGGILISAGLFLGAQADRNHPAVGTIMAGVIFGGTAVVASAFRPRVGWDTVSPSELPPLRIPPGTR